MHINKEDALPPPMGCSITLDILLEGTNKTKERKMSEKNKRTLVFIGTLIVLLLIAYALELAHPGLWHSISQGFQHGYCMAFGYALC
jgi:hypothetical protein